MKTRACSHPSKIQQASEDASAEVRAAREACARLNLELVQVVPFGFGSRFVAKVRDASDQLFALKGVDPNHPTYGREQAVLTAWSDTGSSVRYYGEVLPDVLMLEWLEGTDYFSTADRGAADAELVARTLRTLHEVEPVRGAVPLRERILEDPTVQKVVEPYRGFAVTLGQRFSRTRPAENCLLHGDLHQKNLFRTHGGVACAIDPAGVRGEAAFDLAYFAPLTNSEDPRKVVLRMASAYGRPLPHLSDLFAWCMLRAIRFAEVNFPLPEQAARLRRLGDKLVECGDPAAFLYGGDLTLRAKYEGSAEPPSDAFVGGTPNVESRPSRLCQGPALSHAGEDSFVASQQAV